MAYTSRAVRLWQFLDTIQPGGSVTLEQMVAATSGDDQAVRSMLTKIRQGRVPHPQGGGMLPRIPIHYDRQSGRYFRADKLNDDNVVAGVPQNIYSDAVAQILSRIDTVKESFVPGIKKSVEAELISDPVVVQLLQSIGETRLQDLVMNSMTLLRAYSQMRDQQLTRLIAHQAPMQLPAQSGTE